MTIPYKVGFIGMGNMAQTIIKGLLETKTLTPNQIYASNRTPGKLVKAKDAWGIHTVENNEELIESAEVVVLAMKPQDISQAIDPIAATFFERQIVISLVAGVTTKTLEKKLAQCRIARVMPNTPTIINKGVIGYLLTEPDEGLESLVTDLFNPLGIVLKTEDEAQFEGLMVSCSSGTGFVFELMMYFQDWIEERGFDPITARRMVVQTFAGASQLASQQRDLSLEDLQQKVTSKKGVTAAGLESMRVTEIERALRVSFEKAALRNQELAKQS
jgi:pyrroline-5-carboxylate reductase